jgi:hypothetical protein
MSGRRTSGEVVNATLLEIFLALVFIVLGIAWAKDSDAKRVADNLERERRRGQRLGEKLDTTGAALAEARFNSRFPPYCDNGDTLPLLTITFDRPDTFLVAIQRDRFGFRIGEKLQVPLSRFADTFKEIRDTSLTRGCRYRVRVIDTPGVSKEQYKRSLSRIVSTFYQAGAYQ